jgi:hypothetical protein
MSSSTPKKKSSSSSTSTTPSNTPSKKTTTGGAPLPPSPAVKARREKAPAAPAASSGSNEVSDDNNNANDNASHEDVQQTFLVLLGEHKYKFAAKASSYDELKKQLAAAYSVGYQFDLQYYDSEVAEYLDFSDVSSSLFLSCLPFDRVYFLLFCFFFLFSFFFH